MVAIWIRGTSVDKKNMAVCFDNICDDQPILDVLYLEIFYWKVNSWTGIACLYSAPQLPFNHQLAVPLKMSYTYKAPQLTLHARMLGVKTFPAKATIVVLYDMWFIDEIALSVICVLHVYIYYTCCLVSMLVSYVNHLPGMGRGSNSPAPGSGDIRAIPPWIENPDERYWADDHSVQGNNGSLDPRTYIYIITYLGDKFHVLPQVANVTVLSVYCCHEARAACNKITARLQRAPCNIRTKVLCHRVVWRWKEVQANQWEKRNLGFVKRFALRYSN